MPFPWRRRLRMSSLGHHEWDSQFWLHQWSLPSPTPPVSCERVRWTEAPRRRRSRKRQRNVLTVQLEWELKNGAPASRRLCSAELVSLYVVMDTANGPEEQRRVIIAGMDLRHGHQHHQQKRQSSRSGPKIQCKCKSFYFCIFEWIRIHSFALDYFTITFSLIWYFYTQRISFELLLILFTQML